MALWGNNDNVTSAGIVTCDYTTTDSAGNVIVTGHLTNFGAVGSAKTGDVIRFGLRDPYDLDAVYMGDAVIVSIAGTQQLSIASTHGLSGVAIAGTDFSISELPIYTVEDRSYSTVNDADATIKALGVTALATGDTVIGDDYIIVSTTGLDVQVGDYVLNDGNNIRIDAIGAGATSVELVSTLTADVDTGDTVEFRRLTGGYDKYVYGVAGAGITASTNTIYQLSHAGWVGVTTYIDTHGNLRVKSETLVAASGIQTGNTPIYDENPYV